MPTSARYGYLGPFRRGDVGIAPYMTDKKAPGI